MRKLALIGIFTLTASTAFAQTDTVPERAAGAPPAEAQPAGPGAAQQADAGGPANLCQELVAFMKAPPPGEAAAAPAKPAAQPAREATGSGDSGGPTPQQASDQAGPAHAAPEQGSDVSAKTGAEGAEKKSSLSAPVPIDASSTPKASVMSVSDVETLAATNDIAACKDAARELRLAGVAMPPPLLALAALDLQYQQTGTPR